MIACIFCPAENRYGAAAYNHRRAHERFEELASRHPVQDCWPWTGKIDRYGYGASGLFSEWHAPRASYRHFIGPIPAGLTIDHLCRNRACVNPGHLEPVTRRENSRRGVGVGSINASKTHCINGHLFDERNTYLLRGHRNCRACNREVQRRKRVAA